MSCLFVVASYSKATQTSPEATKPQKVQPFTIANDFTLFLAGLFLSLPSRLLALTILLLLSVLKFVFQASASFPLQAAESVERISQERSMSKQWHDDGACVKR